MWSGWLIVSAVASVIAALLLMRYVPATESDPDGAATLAIVLAIVACIAG